MQRALSDGQICNKKYPKKYQKVPTRPKNTTTTKIITKKIPKHQQTLKHTKKYQKELNSIEGNESKA